MKKLLCMVLIGLLVGATALAAAPQFSDSLFDSAKQAVAYLASGEYERLVNLLPFSDVAPSASEWENFAGNYSDLNNVQDDYAVAWWTGNVWILAVPVQVPDSGSVEVLALSSEDGATFAGYRYATWGRVVEEYSASEKVLWKQEYLGGTPTVIAD